MEIKPKSQEVQIQEVKLKTNKADQRNEQKSDLIKEIQAAKSYANYSFDKEAGVFVTKILDEETKEVQKQYPPEVMLKIAKDLGRTKGNVIDIEA